MTKKGGPKMAKNAKKSCFLRGSKNDHFLSIFDHFMDILKNVIFDPFPTPPKNDKNGPFFGYFHQTAKGGMWVHKCITVRH